MAMVRGCEIPTYLYYAVEHNVWLNFDKGAVTVGMTSYACSLAGEIVALTTKKVGKIITNGQSCATVESGKWVGPVKVPLNCEIIDVNQAAIRDPNLINLDPYGDGWIAKVTPENWAAEVKQLVTGDQALQDIEKKMSDDGFGGC